MNVTAKKALEGIICAARELVTRVDAPEKIPDTCYRGDVSRWNFGYYLSRREKLGTDAINIIGTDSKLFGVIVAEYGENSDEIRYYNRRMAICRSYRPIYDLEIVDL